MVKKDVKYQVIEDRRGCLYLFVFDEEDRVIYGKGGWHLNSGSLKKAVAVVEETGDASELEQGETEPEVLYAKFSRETYDSDEWETVADHHGLYPEKMTASAKIEFEYSMDIE